MVARGIAFAGLVGGRTVIQVVQPDGSDLHAVTSPPGGRDSYGDARPAWSPTGSQIAFTRGDGGDPRNGSGVVYVVSARGGPPRRVGPGAAPVFSPHGRYLAYADRFDSSLAPGRCTSPTCASPHGASPCPVSWRPPASSTS